MRIFLSYSSQDKDIAEQIYLFLINAGHETFFDGAMVQGGDDFNTRIQEHIKNCQVFIFLISPDAVTKPSYALTELKFARQKWKHPQGRVLPVVIRNTSRNLIPPYLQAVSILEPEGNVAAEVGQQVADWQKRHGSRTKQLVAIVLAALVSSLLIAVVGYYHFRTPPLVASPSPVSSSQHVDNGRSPTDGGSNTPSSTKNSGRSQRPPATHATPNANNGQVNATTTAIEPSSFGLIVLSSRVFDEQIPLKGARISIVELPQLGTVETTSEGSFSFHGVPRKINDIVRIRVEHDGFVTQVFPVTIGKYLPRFYLEKVK
jgi:hypothetical protein